MPGRRGYSSGTGWMSGSPGSTLPANPSYSSRSNNTPLEYKATESIEFIPGFESGEGDSFEAYITQGSSGGDGSELASNGIYRYGFNGKENDNDVKGEGNQQDYGMRIYDPRVSRFLTVDPVSAKYPELSPYQFGSNRPIQGVDFDGLEFAETGWPNSRIIESRSKMSQSQWQDYERRGNEAGMRYMYFTFLLPFDAATGFKGHGAVGTALTYISYGNMVGDIHAAGNTKDPEKKKELMDQAKGEMSNLVITSSYSLIIKTTAIPAAQLFGRTVKALTKAERLQEFFRRLNVSGGVKTQEEAISLINKTLDEVEDLHSGIKKAKGIPPRDDGRMYGILDDMYVETLKDGTKVAKTKGNRIILNQDGSFEIQSRDGSQTYFKKNGAKSKE